MLPPLVGKALDLARSLAVARLLAADESARVLHGGWQELLPAEAPFDLLFADGGGQETKTDASLLDLLVPGGTIVLDDLTPGRAVEGDTVRELWLRHPRLAAVELQVSSREAVIVATLQLL